MHRIKQQAGFKDGTFVLLHPQQNQARTEARSGLLCIEAPLHVQRHTKALVHKGKASRGTIAYAEAPLPCTEARRGLLCTE
jgi:hypothetical protein